MSENLTEPAATCDCRSRELLQRFGPTLHVYCSKGERSSAACPKFRQVPSSRAGQGSAGRSALPKVAAFGAAPRGSQLRRPGAGNFREDSLSQGGNTAGERPMPDLLDLDSNLLAWSGFCVLRPNVVTRPWSPGIGPPPGLSRDTGAFRF